MPESESVIRLEGISQVYVSEREASLVIEDLSLEIQKGEFVSLVGPSGCGKTTLLSIIAGLLTPTRGEVKVKGKPALGPSAQIGYMLQQDYLFPWRTILDNALIGLELTGRLDERSRERVRELLVSMGLAGTENQYPSELSGG